MSTPDIDALFADLGNSHPGSGKYSLMEQYSDFRAVFLSSDQGKRVLYEILRRGRIFDNSACQGRFDPNRTMFLEGERNLAIGIFLTAHKEPTEPPSKQVSRDPEAKPK